jgi:hypothetical protein
MGAINNILLIYIVCGAVYIALLAMSINNPDAGNPLVNILYFVFIPFAFLYFIILSIAYGIFGTPTGTL